MNEIINIDSVDVYNKQFGLETLHPLVSVIDMNQATRLIGLKRFNYGIYALFLKMEKACNIKYGRQTYDYQEGTVVCFAPGQTAETTPTTDRPQMNVLGILFHPDLLRGTSLGKNIRNYSFFSYEANEALHLSEEERDILIHTLQIINKELEHGIDRHSKTLLVNYIELLLNYCMRFYERQFVTRSKVNKDILVRFEEQLDAYFQGGHPQSEGLPTVKYFADRMNLSPNYFGDLVKKETGRTAQEYIQGKLIEVAKQEILGSSRSVSEIAYRLGFQYPQHFTRIFKKSVGCTPTGYRDLQV